MWARFPHLPAFTNLTRIDYYRVQRHQMRIDGWWEGSLFQKLDFIARRVFDSEFNSKAARPPSQVVTCRFRYQGLIWEICANSFCTLSQRSAGDCGLGMTPCRINSNSESYQKISVVLKQESKPPPILFEDHYSAWNSPRFLLLTKILRFLFC